jgi:hypothetical protein
LNRAETQEKDTFLKRDNMNNQNYNNQMASQEFFELVEVPQQQYEFEMDSQGYSPSEISSDHDYIPVEDYAPCAAKKRRTTNVPMPTPIESRPGRAPKVSDDQLSQTELERRNRRRARNREAAARQRNRRLAKVDQLEGEVAALTESNNNLQSENERLKAELDQLRFKMKVSPPTKSTKKPLKRPAPVDIKPIVADIPDQLFTPGGNFVLQTPAELKGQNFFPMETSKPDEELIKKEKQFIRQDSFSEYLNLL